MMETDDIQAEACDVLIIGASLAGACLARQLSLKIPELSIINIDKRAEFGHWIGETTVPPWVDYAVRHCGLGPYLWKHHNMKHGARFFFDSEAKDLPLCELSEFGRNEYPALASFHLDRNRFDADLCEMNRASGVDVRLGVTALKNTQGKREPINFDREQGHLVATDKGYIRCKWLVDASGRQAIIPHQLGLLEKDWKSIPTRSYWGRFTNINNIDQLGDREWQRQAGYTERNQSVNQYMYQGYWIWQIPIDDKISSIGVAINEAIHPVKLKNEGDLIDFLKQHRCMRDLLGENPTALDFSGMSSLARHAHQFCSADRWFITGMSSSFIDPLFSSNCMTIAAVNLLIEAVISADRNGDSTQVNARVNHFNAYFNLFHGANLKALDYQGHGSFDSWAYHRNAIVNFMVNWAQPMYLQDLQPLIEKADMNPQATMEDVVQELTQKMQGGFSAQFSKVKAEFTEYMENKSLLYERNRKQFLEGTERVEARQLLHKDFTPDIIAEKRQQDIITYTNLVRHYLSRMVEIEGIEWDEQIFTEKLSLDMSEAQTLNSLLDAMRMACASKLITESRISVS